MPNHTQKADIQSLLKGHQSFYMEYYDSDCDLFDNLVKHGQAPKFMVICCSDSRVDPSVVFSCKPGELFVVRQVANIVPTHTETEVASSTNLALRFAVNQLNIKHIVVLGHTFCGGIEQLLSANELTCPWMKALKNVRLETQFQYRNLVHEEQVEQCGKLALLQSYKNLTSYPVVKERVEKELINLYAWRFDLDTGQLSMYDDKENTFFMTSH